MPTEVRQGKEYALEQLRVRQEKNKEVKQKHNASLPAGSFMYYYCNSCGEEMLLLEGHTCMAPSLCDECEDLKKAGWLE